MYIGGLKVEALRADLMTNWQARKYASLIALQNDDAKNSLWRSIAVNILRSGSSSTKQNKGKAPMSMASYKRPRGSISHNIHGSYGNFGNNGSKGASGGKVSWGHPKDTQADFKSPSKSHISDKKAKFGTSGLKSESKNYDS
jgi:hypothetical protein